MLPAPEREPRRRRGPAVALATILAACGVAGADEPSVALDVTPRKVTVGERLRARITVDLPSGYTLELPELGPEWGGLTVVGGAWLPPEPAGSGTRWTWSAELAAFRTGDVELPPLELALAGPGGAGRLATAPLTIEVQSVLGPAEQEGGAEIADLKPPASVPPDFTPLSIALALLAALGAIAGVAWWLHRRYGAKLAAVGAPVDPFHRVPPHVWVYGELQRLLERRLAERGEIDEFYRELARILKLYLGGRYRLGLMELTTEEVPGALEQAQAPRPAMVECASVLSDCDRVKFAREVPGPESWRTAVEAVYRIVDQTKPQSADGRSAAAGAA